MTGSKLIGSQYRSIEVEDEYDSRIPLHPEEAFVKGVSYKAKLIGTLDIPKPTSRLEIVSSMRRIRYEFKARSIKKRNVSLFINTEGLKVYRKKRRRRKKKPVSLEKYLVMSHPIYRIFYVSHDSQDLKIFSFIARESQSSNFTCSVFKAKKKRHAIRMVRTIGQAFDVCHKLMEDSSEGRPESTSQGCSNIDDSDMSDRLNTELPPYESFEKLDLSLCSPGPVDSSLHLHTLFGQLDLESFNGEKSAEDLHHTVSNELAAQQRDTISAIDQAQTLREALLLERSARLAAQARSQQLLLDNRRLVKKIGQLVQQLTSAGGSLQHLSGSVQQKPEKLGGGMKPVAPFSAEDISLGTDVG